MSSNLSKQTRAARSPLSQDEFLRVSRPLSPPLLFRGRIREYRKKTLPLRSPPLKKSTFHGTGLGEEFIKRPVYAHTRTAPEYIYICIPRSGTVVNGLIAEGSAGRAYKVCAAE